MLRVLGKRDIEILMKFYQKINKFDEVAIRRLYEEIEVSKILVANVIKDNIKSLLITNLIRSNYYIEEIIMMEEDDGEVRDLINYLVGVLRKDERGLNIISDNIPYEESMHEIMLETGFKCNHMSFIYKANEDKHELIKPSILLNDKSKDVRFYIYKNLVDDIKSHDLYSGLDSLIPDISRINLENTNVAVVRDKDSNVIGTIRFSIVSNNLVLDSFYADNEETYEDLMNLVKNLTNKDLEINIYPSRFNVIYLLERLGFIKQESDYIFRLN